MLYGYFSSFLVIFLFPYVHPGSKNARTLRVIYSSFYTNSQLLHCLLQAPSLLLLCLFGINYLQMLKLRLLSAYLNLELKLNFFLSPIPPRMVRDHGSTSDSRIRCDCCSAIKIF